VRLAGTLIARGDFPAARSKLDASLPALENALLPEAVERIEAKSVAADLDRLEAAARH
jgi:hypothetical protein